MVVDCAGLKGDVIRAGVTRSAFFPPLDSEVRLV